jgi:CheY-like chemotaxis protein
VADDFEDNRRLVIYHLRKLGDFEVSEATDGLQVLEAVRRDRPDLIVMDLRMPRLHGWDTLRALGEMPERWAFRVLAISAGGSAEDEMKARFAGCDEFLSAVFANIPTFRRTVERLLARDD